LATKGSQGNRIPVDQRVNRVIRQLLVGGECSAGLTANALDMKLRTLQHQLQLCGTSYQSLYDDARLDLAKTYLETSDLPVSAIAERLSFSDSAALSNFFKNRTGIGPREYTKRFRRT
jgi:AraC-like DNA-binding protein